MSLNLPPTFVSGFHNEEAVKKMKYSGFGKTDLMVSSLSFGTAGFSWLYGDYTQEECKAALEQALKSGVNYIDTAPYYGHGTSEEVLGKCLKGIPRKAYYVATKVGRYEKEVSKMFDFSAKKTKASIDNSLKVLGIDYIDVIQVHDIEFAPSLDLVINETLPVLQEAVKNGKAKYIGITGYPISVLEECIKRSPVKIDSVLCYARMSLVDNTLKEYLPFFQTKKLGIINAAVHCMGLLTNGGPQPWHPAHEEIAVICTEAREYCKSEGVELAKLAMHYAFQQPGPSTVLVGMNSRALLNSNLYVMLNGLNKSEEAALKYLQEKVFSKLTKTHWEGVEIANRIKELGHL